MPLSVYYMLHHQILNKEAINIFFAPKGASAISIKNSTLHMI